MIPLACGTCGISALSVALPFFDEWLWLSLAAFALWNVADYREGCFWQNLPGQLMKLVIGLVVGISLLAGLLLPIWLLYCCGWVLGCLISGHERWLRAASLVWLGLFLGSALWRYHLAQGLSRQDYLLSRFLAGGPGQSYFHELSQQDPFPLEAVVHKILHGSAREAWNASRLLEQRAYKHPLTQAQKEQMRSLLAQTPTDREEDRARVAAAYGL